MAEKKMKSQKRLKAEEENGAGKMAREKEQGTGASGGGIFASCSFTDLGLHPTLCQHLKEKMGFVVPTLIQAQAIPVVLSGKDVLVNAATGTGKTIVYLATIVHHLQMITPRIEHSDETFGMIWHCGTV